MTIFGIKYYISIGVNYLFHSTLQFCITEQKTQKSTEQGMRKEKSVGENRI